MKSLWGKTAKKGRVSPRDCAMIIAGALVVLAGVLLTDMIKHPATPLGFTKPGITIPWISPTVKRWEKPINQMAERYDVDPNYLAIIMTVESGGYSKAQSEASAKGLMQVTTITGQDIAARYLKQPVTDYDLMNPETSIEFGAAYLALLRKEFGTAEQGPDWNTTAELVAAGYNGGPGAANNLEQGKGLEDTQTVVYSRDVFNMWRERAAAKSPTYDRWLERGGAELVDLAKAEKSGN